MAIYSLTTSDDTIPGTTGDDTVNATSSTLNSTDSLTGDAGTDTLALNGGGQFQIDQLAGFTGFEAVTVNNASSAYSYVYLGSFAGSLTSSQTGNGYSTYFVVGSGAVSVQRAAGNLIVLSGTAADWNSASSFSGGNTQFYLQGQSYDFTGISFGGLYNEIYGQATNQTLTINSAVAANVYNIYTYAAGSVLTTSAATLDLSTTTVDGYNVTSTNATGTTFTVGSLTTANQIQGGIGNDKIVATGFTFTQQQRDTIFAFSSIESIQDQSGIYTAPAPSPNVFTLTAGTDTLNGTTGNDTFRTTAERLNATDSLTGDAGTDTLALYGGGQFQIDQLAGFTGFEAVTLNNASSASSYVYLGSFAGSLTSSGGYSTFFVVGSGAVSVQRAAGNLIVLSGTAADWNSASSFSGGSTQFYLQGQSYDFTGNSFGGLYNEIYGQATNQTLTINSAVAANVYNIYTYAAGSVLTTSAATLDLSNTTVSGYTVTSTNATGTTFTVGSLTTANQIQGGIGNDKIVATGFTFTQQQRDTIFAFSSIESIQDQSGIYTAPAPSPNVFTLTTGTDTLSGTTGNDTFRTTADRLNSTDSLTGDAGTDTLALNGGGQFQIDQLAGFTGFEAVTVNNASSAYSYVYLGSFAGSLTSSQTGNGYSTFFVVGSGAVSVQRAAGNLIVLSGTAADWNSASSFSGGSTQFYLQGQSYDFTGNSFGGLYNEIYGQATNQTLTINSAVAANVYNIYTFAGGSVLTTSAATLDLSNTTVGGYNVTSTNATGTTFTVGSLTTANQIQGGIGNDKIVATGFTFTQQQRDAIFANGSVEILQDSNGTYTTPYPAVEAFLTSDTGASATDRITTNAAISGTGDANAVVTIRVDNVAAGTVNANAQGQWSYTPTGLAEGAHSVAASESNNGGYTRISTVNFNLDTSLPATTVGLASDTGASSTDRITSNAAISGTTQANATVSLVLDGGAPVVVTANNSGAWTYTPSGLTQGDHTIAATATDLAGNTGAGASLNFTYDTALPPVSVALATDSGTPADLITNSAALTGTTQANASVSLSIDNASPITVTANGSGVWSYTPSSLSQGAHTVVATATDPAGNTGTSSSLSFTYDSLAPAAPAAPVLAHDTGASGTDHVTRNPAITYPAASAGNVLLYKLDNGSYATTAPTFATDGTADGSHTVYIAQQDTAGNIGNASSLAFTLDTSVADALSGPSYPPPGLVNYSPSGNSGRAGGQVRTFTIDPTATDELFFGPEPNAAMDGAVDSASERLAFLGVSGATASWIGTTTITLTSGTQTVYTRFTATVLNDTASPWYPASHTNISTGAQEVVAVGQTGTFQVRLEYSASYTYSATGAGYLPFLTFYDGQQTPANAGPKAVTSTAGDFYWNPLTDTNIVTAPSTVTNDPNASFSFSSNETGVSYQVSLDGAAYVNASSTPSFTNLAEGTHTLNVRAIDADGFADAAPALYSWTVDVTPPVVTAALVNDTSGGNQVTTDATVSGMAEPNATVTLLFDGTLSVTVAADGFGAWSYDPGYLGEGPHTVDVSQTDDAGNLGATTLQFVIDTETPVVTVALANDTSGGSAVTSDATLSGMADANSTVSLVIDIDAPVLVTTDNSGLWSYDPGILGRGPHSVNVSQTDAAGNTGTATTLAFTLDPDTPVVSIALIADSGTAGDFVTNSAALTGAADADGTISLVIDGNAPVIVATDSNGVWTYTPSGLAQGSHTVIASQTDTAGNTGTAPTLTFTLDNASPLISGPVLGDVTQDGLAVTLDALGNAADPDGSIALAVVQASLPNVLPAGVTYDSGTHSFTLDPTNAAYKQLAAGATQTVSVTYQVTDSVTTPTSASVSWTVTGINDAPAITSNGGGATASIAVAENSTTVTTVVATDVDGTAPAYAIVGGADATLFTIDATTGALSFITAPDYEARNSYEVIVRASDDFNLTAQQTITVNVTNVNEAPVNTVPGAQTIVQDTAVTIAGLSVFDVDGAGSILTTTLGSIHGVLTLASSSGLTVTVTGDGTGTVTLSGTAANINAAIAGVTYKGGIGFTGADTLTILTSDGTASDSDSVGITVAPKQPFATPSLGLSDLGTSGPAGAWNDNDRYPRELADVNGDGRVDVVAFGSAGVYVALGNAAGGFGAKQLKLTDFGTSNAAGAWSSNDLYHRELADVNGDGRADIVAFGSAGVYVALGSGAGGFAAKQLKLNDFGTSNAAGAWTSDNIYHRELGDVNGDGRADIVAFGNAGVYVALANNSGGFAAKQLVLNQFGVSNAAGGWSNNDLYHRELADVNGDGRVDIVGFGNSGVSVALGTSAGGFGPAQLALADFGVSPAAGAWTSDNRFHRELGDVNGDGRADVIGFGNAGVYVALANSSGGFDAKQLLLNSFGVSNGAGGWSSETTSTRHLGDVNGDGLADIVGFGAPGAVVALSQDSPATGGVGANTFMATAAEDTFRFTKVAESPVGGGDTIIGFDAAHDSFVFSNMSGANGFTGQIDYRGSNAFTGTPGAPHSEARLDISGGQTMLQIDVNGDGAFGANDIEILLTNHIGTLVNANFHVL